VPGKTRKKEMRGLWLENQSLGFKIDLPMPAPNEAEALIRVRLAGVCSTDLELVRGYYPFTGVPGHEFVGDVVSSPHDPSWVGKRVVGEINIACGVCVMCQSGFPRHCERRRTLGIHDWNGVFAEYLVLPLTNLHVVPVNIPDQAAVFTEPLAAANEILVQTHLDKGDNVLIIGAGRLGQLLAQVLQQTGCKVEVLVRHSKPHQLLAARGIRTITEPELGGKKYDVVVEATGTPDGFSLAMKSIRPRGRLILKSTYKGDVQVNFSAVVVDEVTLIGSRCGPFEPALKLLAEGTVDPLPLVESVFSLEQGLSAFKEAALPGVLKILVQP
jgi:2-desacetyl-2-hydroxyethyl bacteriochlorophyllide A dehydrogenase